MAMNKFARTLYEDLKAERLEYFNMREVFAGDWAGSSGPHSPPCGTPSCILGHAGSRLGFKGKSLPIPSIICALGLYGSVAGNLFFPTNVGGITRDHPWFGLMPEGKHPIYCTDQPTAAKALKRAVQISDRLRAKHKKAVAK